MIKWKAASLAVPFVLLGACASGGPVGQDPTIEVASLETLPVPGADDFAMPAGVARIRPLDKIKIEVFGVEELERELTVDSDGTVDYPLIGTVVANGLTSGELAAAIEDGLRGPYLRNPDVTVAVLETPGQLITVGGEVGEPGQYPVVGSMSLMDAVAAGNGGSDGAKLTEVAVFRTVAGQRYIGLYDLKAIARGNYPDPQVYPNDVVMVGESQTRKFFNAIAGVAPLLTTGVILVDRLGK